MPNGVKVNYDFDECGRLTLLENILNQTVIAKSAYTYDANANRISFTDENNQVTEYAYNALDQLEGITIQGGSSIQYNYDEVGNKLSVDESINNTEPTNDYQYDYEDRLIQTTKDNDTITYTYDGDGTLVKKTITGTVNMTYEYFYDYTAGLPRLLVEKKSDGTTYDYLYVGGKLYGRKDSTGTVYYHQDGLGSVVALTDENGNILNKYAYDPFGEPHILQETVENSMLFIGEPFDQSGLIYLRARYYDPKTGRFVSSDKYKGEIADPSSQNSYAYCGNNPVNAVDPSGFDKELDEYINTNYSGKTTVTIVIRRPVANSRVAAAIVNGKLENGHSFLRLDDGNGNVNYIGFGPNGGSLADMIMSSDVESRFVDDSNTDWNVAKIYEISDEQYLAISKYISEAKSACTAYNIETNNCTTFAVAGLKRAGIRGCFMPIKQHNWTLPDNIGEQLSTYKAKPGWVPNWLGAFSIKTSMGNNYGYTPADAAQDLKKAEGNVLLKYNSDGVKVMANIKYFSPGKR